jgi:hypothetical protein
VAGAGLVAGHYTRYQRLAGLIPDRELPKSDAEGRARSAKLVTRFPNDPRAHLYRGSALQGARNGAAAEHEFGIAVAQADQFRFFLGANVANVARTMLATAQRANGRLAEAKETVRPLCQAPAAEAPSEGLKRMLATMRLCD